MDINYRYYPYPVLWDKNDNYKTSKFSCQYDLSKQLNKFKVEVTFTLDNEELLGLLDNGYVEFLIHVESPRTSYREIYVTSGKKIKFEIHDKDVAGKIQLCPFIVCKKDIINYYSKDFHDDYTGVEFQISRGSKLAIADPLNITVDKEKEELASVPSIFTIYRKETLKKEIFDIEMNSEKIKIGLTIEDYENYNLIGLSQPNTLNAIILLTAFTHIFQELKEGFYEYEEYRWFKSIVALYKKENIIFDLKFVNSTASYILAQEIMNMPLNQALCEISAKQDEGD